MKKISVIMAVFVLTVSLLTGCGCTRQGAGMNTEPNTEMTILPTNIPETTAPIMPSTEPMTEAPTQMPTESAPMGTEDGGITDSITGETGSENSRMR